MLRSFNVLCSRESDLHQDFIPPPIDIKTLFLFIGRHTHTLVRMGPHVVSSPEFIGYRYEEQRWDSDTILHASLPSDPASGSEQPREQ